MKRFVSTVVRRTSEAASHFTFCVFICQPMRAIRRRERSPQENDAGARGSCCRARGARQRSTKAWSMVTPRPSRSAWLAPNDPISAPGHDADLPRRGARAFGVAAHDRGHHLIVIVEARGGPVHGADERALPAADHAEAQPPTQARNGGVHDASRGLAARVRWLRAAFVFTIRPKPAPGRRNCAGPAERSEFP
jgi:hypothetical protein